MHNHHPTAAGGGGCKRARKPVPNPDQGSVHDTRRATAPRMLGNGDKLAQFLRGVGGVQGAQGGMEDGMGWDGMEYNGMDSGMRDDDTAFSRWRVTVLGWSQRRCNLVRDEMVVHVGGTRSRP